MKIVGEVKGYIIHKTDNGNHFLCKILKEYGNDSEAEEKCTNDLVALLSNNTTEKKLLKENQIMRWKE
jgi:hypothetical protein